MDPVPTYGAAFADVYDDWYALADDVNEVVAFLVESQPATALELGVGTGRIAIPLAYADVSGLSCVAPRVFGIDQSPEMLGLLFNKDQEQRVQTIEGDMAHDLPVQRFDLVYVSYNTLFNVADPNAQQACLRNVAARLNPSGRLVIDACVIDPDAPTTGTTSHRRDEWNVHSTSTFDPLTGSVTGLITSTHDDGRRIERPWRITYRSPVDLDEMCDRAGLVCTARYSTWSKAPFDEHSPRHISVYRHLR